MSNEMIIRKMSTAYFKVMFLVLETYGAFLKEQADNYEHPLSDYHKDHSIALDLYFKIEPKVSKKATSRPKREITRANKYLKIHLHSGLVLLDAIAHCWGTRDFSHTPAMEHIKDEISKAIL